ncbi:protein transport protein sec31-like [Schistocerca americana]|uniref:protein transport protein sec31-like n=1 Tax=Schistocerca americana TaxID=7009 RepID=UPI001F4FEB0B|nr:protein transport protein sec31-like [Schistocerca americana]
MLDGAPHHYLADTQDSLSDCFCSAASAAGASSGSLVLETAHSFLASGQCKSRRHTEAEPGGLASRAAAAPAAAPAASQAGSPAKPLMGRRAARLKAETAHLVRGGFQPRLPTSLPPPGQQQQQQQPSPLPRRQPVPLMPPAQLHSGAPQVLALAPAVPLQSPPPSELMDVDPPAGPPSQAVAVQPVLQSLSLGTPKESDTAAPCPAPNQQPSTQRQETLPLFVGPDAPSRPVPEAAPVVTGISP